MAFPLGKKSAFTNIQGAIAFNHSICNVFTGNKYRLIVGCLGCSPLDFNLKERREGRQARLEKLNTGEIGRTRKEGRTEKKEEEKRKEGSKAA